MKHGAKMAFDGLKLAQDGRKLDPRWPKIGPRRGQKGAGFQGTFVPWFRTVLVVRLDVILRPSWALLGPSWPIMGILGTISGVIKYARAYAQHTGLLYFAARSFKHNILAAK